MSKIMLPALRQFLEEHGEEIAQQWEKKIASSGDINHFHGTPPLLALHLLTDESEALKHMRHWGYDAAARGVSADEMAERLALLGETLVEYARSLCTPDHSTNEEIMPALYQLAESFGYVTTLSTSNGAPHHAARYLVAALSGASDWQAETLEHQRNQIADLRAQNTQAIEKHDANLLARVAELAALQRVNNAANSSLKLDDVLKQAVDAVADVTKADVCSIFLFDESKNRLILGASRGLKQEEIGRISYGVGDGITGRAAAEGRPIAVHDVQTEQSSSIESPPGEQPYRSTLSVPIILFTSIEKLVGVLNVQTLDWRDFSQEEIRFLETVAGQIAIAIENARLYSQTDEQLRRTVNELTTLQRVSALITSTLDLSQVLNIIVHQAVTLSRTDMAALFALDGSSRELRIIASEGFSDDYVREMRIMLGEGFVGRAIESGVPAMVSDIFEITGDSEMEPYVEMGYQEGYRSLLSVPLMNKQRLLGGIVAYTRQPHRFSQEEVNLLLSFANQAAIAIDNAHLYEEARRSLAVKSALLQEMHHRVKNNLSTVAALLSLQLRRAKSSDLARPLADSVGRIQSIAAVHDLLSKEQQVGITYVANIAKQIADIARNDLLFQGMRLTFKVEDAGVLLGSKEATVLALLLNEMVSNAIEHGFGAIGEPEERRAGGIITIRSFYTENGDVVVEVADNGKGLATDFDANGSSGLGLQIVRTLVNTDLQGEFTMSPAPDGGTVARITFTPTVKQGTDPASIHVDQVGEIS